jgi:hypothetical protein
LMPKDRRGGDRERLLRIISLCLSVESRSSDPFEVEVKKILGILRRYLPNWKFLEDFTLDAEALNRIASVITLQGDWIKNRSTSLYVDPLLIELKIKMMDAKDLVKTFSKSWHPVVEMEGLSRRRVGEAVEYWNQLSSLEERRLKLPTPSPDLGSTTIEELVRLRIMSDESFNETLQRFWRELREEAGEGKRVSYWRFIIADTYDDTIYRAYLTSFLVTYGYADMEFNPLEEEAFLIPQDEPRVTVLKKQSISIPIAIDRELWESKRRVALHG